MNQSWCVLSERWQLPLGTPSWLAQANPVEVTVDTTGQLLARVWAFLPSLLGAIAILIIGWLVALVVAAAVQGLLHRTTLDDRVAAWMTGRRDPASKIPVEKWVATAVFWLIMLFVIVAFLNALQLPAVSTPLNAFLQQVFSYLPRIAGAVLLLAVAWLLATLAKAVVVRGLARFNLDDRLAQQTGTLPGESPFLLNETLGNALYWFVLLFFLPLILDVLQLQGPLQPVQNLLNQILLALPRILTAVIIAAIGWFIARIVRGIVTNLLAAMGTNQIGARLGLTQTGGGLSLSALIGTIVYVLILIPTAIAALNALQIQAISAPAIRMLEQILTALPLIFTAALILAIFYVIGRFVADLVANILASIGFNNIFSWLGFPASAVQPPPPPPPSTIPSDEAFGSPTVIQPEPLLPRRTPSEIAGIIVLVGIMLLGAVAATEVLRFAALTAIVNGLLVVLARVLVGVVILGVGLYLANLAFNLIASSGGRQAQILGQAARIAIIALVSAMALQQMGIASSIVNLAFGLLVGAIAVAIALAFGLGGREIAAEQIRDWLHSFRRG
ncbi:MAG: mechanosensitive ion channel [Synechococcales cyanobacterium C42_A2020_086]|nr:mechanosensitive ion channel [Synechococcales cyanobacterium M58_A2018_015]MBF2073579.1 mechanosensitive ion channel [Synechococcales cyanobacterium C42_A2020_086]